MAHLLDRAIKEGATVDQAEILISRGVEEIPVGVTTSILAGVTGEPSGVVASFRNLSEIKMLSERVQMSEHLAALGEMAAGIAHEVRNPLNSIRGFASLIKERVEDEKLGQFSSIIVDEVDRMNNLVNDLLDFARHRELDMGRVNLRKLVGEVGHGFSPQMQSANVESELDLPDDLPDVWGNADRLKQVTINIVRNAIEAMPEGGRLSISAGSREVDSGAVVTLSVSDSGSGIPPEIVTKIFTPFFSRKDAGTGLGLAICQKIVKQHQGRIEVESEEGKGTTFTILLQPYRERSD
jgi:signal transduction histidine kinase